MKIKGGTIYELDPTKWYWLVIDSKSGINPERIIKRDGNIIITNDLSSISLIESADRIKGYLSEDKKELIK